MPTIGEAATINGDDETLDGRAKRLWMALVGKCTGLGIPVRKVGSAEGYLYNGSINAIAGEVWPHLLVKDGRESPVSKSFVATLKNHLKGNKNVNFDVVRGSLFVSAIYHEPKVKTGRGNPISFIVEPDEMSILDKSKKIWTSARNYCSNKNRPVQVIEGVSFWECDKPLNYFVKGQFPELHDYERQKKPIYDFLRSTTNAVNVGSKTDESMKDGEHHWLIRDDWCEAGTKVVFRSPKAPDSIDKRAARLTEKEAGEDRVPAPVVVTTKATPEATPVPDPVPAPKPTPPVEEEIKCPHDGCSYVAKGVNSLNAHSKVHRTPAALKQVIEAVEQGIKDAAKVTALTTKVESLTDDLARTKAELDIARTQGDASTLIELLTDVLSKCSNGTISPMRAVADVDDLLRTMKGQK